MQVVSNMSGLPVEIQFKIMSYTPHPLAKIMNEWYDHLLQEYHILNTNQPHLPDTYNCMIDECDGCRMGWCNLPQMEEAILATPHYREWEYKCYKMERKLERLCMIHEWELGVSEANDSYKQVDSDFE